MSEVHEELYKEAEQAIEELFGDKSVGIEQTMESLQSLVYQIETMIVALKEDSHGVD